MNALPVVMVRNEEFFIRQVLTPLQRVFGRVLVADTGSSDRTVELARAVAHVDVLEVGPQNAAGLTRTRQMLSRQVQARGYQWELMVDGDELYCEETLAALKAVELPPGKQAGFVTMISIDVDERGQFWELDDVFNRLCIHPAGVEWTGQYPFDVPAVFGQPEGFWYAELPTGYRYHALHLHRLQRSTHDAAVWLRKQKQYQFSMQDAPAVRTLPLDAAAWGLLEHA